MPDRNFIPFERVAVIKDGKLLEGLFDVWFMDDGLFFLHFRYPKKDLYEGVRREQWGMRPEERLRGKAGSFFLGRGEIISRRAHPLHVDVMSGLIKLRSADTHVLELGATGGTIKLAAGSIKAGLGDLETYFSGGAVFKGDKYTCFGLDIDGPAPAALVSQVAAKNVEPSLSAGTLERLVKDRDYMDRFWSVFSGQVSLGNTRGAAEYMLDRFPPEFRREILDRGRRYADPKSSTEPALMALLGAGVLALAIVLKPLWLKIAAGGVGLFLLILGLLFIVGGRKHSKIWVELIGKRG